MMFVHQPRSGIKSKLNYTFGFFHMNIKLPANDSGGVVTAFCLSLTKKKKEADPVQETPAKKLKSEDSELDFEFSGNRKEKPIRVQTNVFLKGKGGREQRIHVWF
ncbi:Xyloglucan endotransglucosylase/hydrolase [Camellia lanceoleosa]|uniref:Xyloglucan endotransglucosylase/hydrolase n=1 Tax=Camellia lanceoleosa TaxID=1840588 RepID=A0ACC0GKS0_9ERIC|nr:Xyloglucan endotransglucosylase/hydrolase [Camellia lanceoleosa]